MEHVIVFGLKKKSVRLLALLFLIDCIFVLLHGIYKLHLISNPLFSIERELGYAEVFQYIKELSIMLLLLKLARNRKQIIFFAWSLLFLYFLLDDSFQIHENLGSFLAHYLEFQPMFYLRAQDFGELSVSMFFGVLLFSFIGGGYLFSDSKAKQVSKYLFILVMYLAFFGVFVDMLHIAIPWGKSIWGLIEDAGEMVVMSIIVWYVYKQEQTPSESIIDQKNV
ncbi:MAG: hypothetical protein L3J75_13985 [Methylococcaceae bacterium]|nr:hypothetical protein [Methylococcaceae bacterium]